MFSLFLRPFLCSFPPEYKNAFELQSRDHGVHVLLVASSPEEKSNWMAALISLQTKSMLERQLDAILRDEEQNTPLKLPDPSEYRWVAFGGLKIWGYHLARLADIS